jgi:mannose-6-phosphate isomerase-like protein (cupin superfamily)
MNINEKSISAVVLEANEGKNIKFLREDITVKMKSAGLDILEGLVLPQSGPPLHFHANQDEAFYVLEGVFAFKLSDEPIKILDRGGFVFIPRGTVHSYKNIGTQTGKMISIMTPGGFVDFWEELSLLPTGKADISKVNEIGKKHGNINVGAPL